MLKGDALAALGSLPAESVDAFLTDPPYSSGGMFRGDRAKGTGEKYIQDDAKTDMRPDFPGDSRDQRSFALWCALWLGEAWRAAKPGALLAVFADWRQLASMTDAVQAGGWVFRGIVPWNKTEATRPQKGWFRSQCEYIVVAAKGKPALYGHPDAPCLPGFFVCPTVQGAIHQTQKPVEVLRWLCRLVPKGGIVCDPFAGSGTTGIAARMEGLRFVGVELTDYFAAAAVKRMADQPADAPELPMEAAA